MHMTDVLMNRDQQLTEDSGCLPVKRLLTIKDWQWLVVYINAGVATTEDKCDNITVT